ncbi:MAG TPA: hypothetical protein VFG20_16070 [Planctomycetaceae bacterium]|nr:hypothetical protein [Planctomycetaceae bacterium]
MSNAILRWLAVPVCLVVMTGCGREPMAVVDTTQRVYVDTATQTALMLPIQEKVPAKHPQTGKNTLVPGLYCPQCGRWYPAPPMEVVQRTGTASRCPQGGHPMSPHGPSPQG